MVECEAALASDPLWASTRGRKCVLVLIVVALYLIPTVVAQVGHVPNAGSVAVINVFLGWRLVGWVVAPAMAARPADRASVLNIGRPTGPKSPSASTRRLPERESRGAPLV